MKAPIIHFTDGYDVVQREVVICRDSAGVKARSPALQSYRTHNTPRWASSSHSSCLSILSTSITGMYPMPSSPHICYGLGLTSPPNCSSGELRGLGGLPPQSKAGSLAGEAEMGTSAELTVGWLEDPLMLHSSTQKEEHWLQAASSLLSR